MNAIEIINVLYVIAAFSGMLLVAHKKSIGFLVFLVAEMCMLCVGIHSEQYGMVTMALVYFVTNIWAYRKWEKSKGH